MVDVALKPEPFTLAHGGHGREFSGAACFNELASVLAAGEPFSDSPSCVSPIVRRLGMALNDRLDDEKRQLLRPFVLRSLGTAGDGREEERRQMCNEWLLHYALPLLLDKAGRQEAAQRLRDLPSDLGVEGVRRAIGDARDEAWAARTEARSRLKDRIHAELEKRGVKFAAAAAVAVADAAAVAVADAVAAAVADAVAVAAADAAAVAVKGLSYSDAYWKIRSAVYNAVYAKAKEIAAPLNDQLLPSALELLDRMLPPSPLAELAVPLEDALVICGISTGEVE